MLWPQPISDCDGGAELKLRSLRADERKHSTPWDPKTVISGIPADLYPDSGRAIVGMTHDRAKDQARQCVAHTQARD